MTEAIQKNLSRQVQAAKRLTDILVRLSKHPAVAGVVTCHDNVDLIIKAGATVQELGEIRAIIEEAA